MPTWPLKRKLAFSIGAHTRPLEFRVATGPSFSG